MTIKLCNYVVNITYKPTAGYSAGKLSCHVSTTHKYTGFHLNYKLKLYMPRQHFVYLTMDKLSNTQTLDIIVMYFVDIFLPVLRPM